MPEREHPNPDAEKQERAEKVRQLIESAEQALLDVPTATDDDMEALTDADARRHLALAGARIERLHSAIDHYLDHHRESHPKDKIDYMSEHARNLARTLEETPDENERQELFRNLAFQILQDVRLLLNERGGLDDKWTRDNLETAGGIIQVNEGRFRK
jgi:hypothetical protein